MVPRLTTYTVQDLAELVDRDPVTVRRWIRRGYIKAARIGREYRISEAELERWWRERSGGGSLFGYEPEPAEGDDDGEFVDNHTLSLEEWMKSQS